MFELRTYTGGIVETNAHLLKLPGGSLLVDAPEGVADWLEASGEVVDALLLTHQHFDHVLDAAEIRRRHGCPIHAWAPFSRQLTLESLFGAVTGSAFAVPAFEVDEVLEGRTSLTLAGCEWSLHPVPGHSPDSLCFYQAELGLLFGGDVLFRGSVGRTDFPGGSFATLLEGIQNRLWPLPPSTRVLPGHGPETTLGQERRSNPFLQR